LVGGSEEKKALGRPRHKWKGNIKKDLKEICWEGVNSIQLAQDIKGGKLPDWPRIYKSLKEPAV
jgi:hypothetical protein